ncbi:hypothetical protein ACLB1N_17835 [Escherichia coli]
MTTWRNVTPKNNRPLFEFLGLTVGINLPGMPAPAKREAYAADITYGRIMNTALTTCATTWRFSPEERVQRKLHYAPWTKWTPS